MNEDSTMKALRFGKFGPPSVLAIEEISKPQPRDGEALVRINASAINPSDVKNVSGHFRRRLCRARPDGTSQESSLRESSSKARKYGELGQVWV
jgi:NADPH:quinone reductase-like Zn-dependent oxidoreductase